MPEQGLSPGIVTYNTLMDLLLRSRVGNLKETIKLFKHTKDRGHVANMMTYSTLMEGLFMKAHPMKPMDY